MEGNGRYRGGQYILPLNLLIFLFIKTCEGRGRALCLQKYRKYGHVIEVVTLMEGEWSYYGGGQFKG